MSLPVIEVPTYEVKLPVSGKDAKYRPFLVKEEKILLMALEGGEEKEMVEAIRQTMVNCVQSLTDPTSKRGDDTIKLETVIKNLPLADFEYLFLKIRSKSVGEQVDLKFRCKNPVEKDDKTVGECGNVVAIPFNIDDIILPVTKKEDRLIQLSPNLGLQMNYPKYEIMSKIQNWEEKSSFELLIDLIKECIDSVYDADTVYPIDNEQELDEFLNSLNTEQFNKILAFFNSIPTLKKDLNFECKKCGNKEVIHLEGVQSFFG